MESGTRLGPYEIRQQIGAGGMGEVYLAEDTRLGRQVAIKVLPEEFARDPERLARFEQEARAAAALNHPHIAAVFDVGYEAGMHFMVQEYLSGESLRATLEKGPIDLKRALALGMEMAEALQAAHRVGIVHRDLKPENLFVSADGHVKVLDFGLAKLTDVAAGPLSSQSMSPTALGTQAGIVMGTAGYMAPEQVQGEPVDARADVFALGCVLWEMVIGRRAFAGKSVPHTLHKILDEEPDGRDLQQGLPLRLQWLLDRTLAKSIEDRAQSAADVLAEMRRVATEVESGAAITQASSDGRAASGPVGFGLSWQTAAPAAALLLLTGATLTWWLASSSPAAPRHPWRFDIPYPGDTRIESGNNRSVAISPDGSVIAFEADAHLWIRRVGDHEPSPVRGTDEARSIFFSPDGSQIGFFSGTELMRVAVTGGAPVLIGNIAGRPVGASWGEDGYVYVGQGVGGIVRLPGTGGTPERVVEVQDGELAASPHLLLGGQWVIFTLGQGAANWDQAEIVAESLRDGERRILVSGGRDARVTASGYLVYGLRNGLYAQPFDVATVSVSGGPVSLIEGIRASNGNSTADLQYDLSAAGDLIYVRGSANVAPSVALVWRTRDGQTEPLPLEPAAFARWSLSPDGNRVAVQVEDTESGTTDVWLYRADRPGGQRLTVDGARAPVWSPDGAWVYFSSAPANGSGIWRRRADLTTPPDLVYEAEGTLIPAPFGGDGTRIPITAIVDRGTSLTNLDVAVLTLGDEPVLEPVVANETSQEFAYGLSPDGRYLLYGSRETGRQQVYVMELATRRPWLVSTEGGLAASWSADGGRIWFVDGAQLWEVQVTTEPEFSTSPPRPILDRVVGDGSVYVATPDGERFLSATSTGDPVEGEAAPLPHIVVALNWFEELNQRVPIAR